MSCHRALVVVAGLVLSVAAQAQQEPPLIFTGPSGRPAGGRCVVDDGQEEEIVHSTVVVQPKPNGNPQGYAIIEIKGGLPIIITASDIQTFVQSQQGSQGQLVGGYNGDNDDFVVVSSNNSVLVLNGAIGDATGPAVTGLFSPQQTFVLPSPPPPSSLPSPRLVATVDANGDVWDDIVVAGPDGVQLYLNNLAAAVPTFTLVAVLSSSAPVGTPGCTLHDVTDIAVGDVDGDGHDDLALSAAHSFTDGEVQIWKRSGLIGFTQGVTLTFLGEPVASVELVKLRTPPPGAAGIADLVMARHVHGTGTVMPPASVSGIVSVHLNPGDWNPNNPNNGLFSASTPYYVTRWSSTGTLPTFGAAGRIDNDDDLDLVFTQNDSIAYQPGSFAQFNPPLVLLHVVNQLSDLQTITFETRGTRFTGKAVDPIFMESEQPGSMVQVADHLLVTWTVDQNAGMGDEELLPDADESAKLSFSATGTGDGVTFDVPKHVTFKTGEIPGDGATADVAVGETLVRGYLDLVVPSLSGNSLTVALGDGAGGFDEVSQVTNIATPPAAYVGGGIL